jgi:hypothetical protein
MPLLVGRIRSLLLLGAKLCCPAAVRQPGYLPARRSLGFAPPPHDGFALLANAHTDALACWHIPNACYECTTHRVPKLGNTPPRIFPQRCSAPCCFASRSLMPALIPMSDEFAMNFEGLDVFFRHIYCSPQHFLRVGAHCAENVCTQSFESPMPHKIPCRIGSGLSRTSQNALKAK